MRQSACSASPCLMLDPAAPLQYNIYLRNVNKVALFRRVIDRQAIKRVSRERRRAALADR